MRGRYIRGNASCRTPGNSIVLHAETVESPGAGGQWREQTLSVAAVRHWRSRRGEDQPFREYVCATGDAVWASAGYSLDRWRPTWVWCYDLGRTLTLTKFWRVWESGFFAPKAYSLGDGPQWISGSLGGRRLNLIDLRNWLPHPLCTLREWAAVEAWSPSGSSGVSPDARDLAHWSAGVLHHCVRAIYRLVRFDNLGCLRYTAAAQAMQSWRHRWLSHDVAIPSHPCEPAVAEACHYGGRAELFYRGRVTTPVHVCDVSGLYGSVELCADLPIRHLDYSREPTPDALRRSLDQYAVCARVLVDTSDPLPVRVIDREGAPADGVTVCDPSVTGRILPTRTLHAVGRYWTALCGPELRRALESRSVVRCAEATSYVRAPALRDAAAWWWERRCRAAADGDGLVESICKAMPCALYGRWAMRAWQWEAYPGCNPQIDYGYMHTDHPEWGSHCLAQVIAGDVRVRTSWRASEYYFPALAAYIAAGARARMDELRALCPPRSILYQVCDALHLTDDGRAALLAAGQIAVTGCGLLRDVETFSDVEYYSTNLIRVDGTLHAAGLPECAAEIEPGECEAVITERTASILHRGPDGTVRSVTVPWRPSYTYRHSVVGADGWCRPHVLPREGDAAT